MEQNMKTWGGRFTGKIDDTFERFNNSFPIDQRLIFEDIEGSMAYASALEKSGILSYDELKHIGKGLAELKKKIENDPAFLKNKPEEDVHTFVETRLAEIIGDAALKLHTGRSRNDQVAVDTRLYMKRAIIRVQVQIKVLNQELLRQSKTALDIIFPGYTHMRKAQPILLAHYWLAFFEMFLRDYRRFDDCFRRTDYMPLGSGALAGNGFPIDRDSLRKELGFGQLTRNSLDAVSDRDYLVEFISNAALTMMHLSRLAEDLIILSAPEFGLFELSDAVTTGSSIMPQKKNPDSLELIRGKCGRVFGHLTGMLTLLKGLPLAYNKDLQEDKEMTFDALDTLMDCLQVAQVVIRTLKVNREKAQEAVTRDFINATDLADYLVRKGMPFRKAHEVVGKIVVLCESRKIELLQLPLEEYQKFSPLIESDVINALSLTQSVNARSVVGGTALSSVKEALLEAERVMHLGR
jgi:argininosuccinate lyase